MPIILGALVMIRGMLPYDAFMYVTLQKIFYTPTVPLFWLMEKTMQACGIQGEEGMRFMIPMFFAMLIYWALLGYGFGFLIGKLNEFKRHNKS